MPRLRAMRRRRIALLKISKLLGDEKYEKFAVTVLRLVAPQIRRYPNAFGRSLSTLEFYLGKTKEIVVIGEKGNELEKAVWENYLPDKVVVLSNNPAENADFIPLLESRAKIGGNPTAFVCENFVCQKPVTSTADLIEQLN